MSAALGWALATAALVVGYMGYGWPGVLLALTVVVFWLLLQFSRALRVMRVAAERPVGSIGNVGRSALMLQSKLQRGMRLAQVMKLTGSFGVAVAQPGSAAPDTEVFAWTDAGGDTVQVTLTAGKLAASKLLRAGPAAAAATVVAPGAPGA